MCHRELLSLLNCEVKKCSLSFSTDLQQYIKPVVLTLLQRMQSSKTDTYAQRFAFFFLYSMSLNSEGLTPDCLITAVESIQPQ